MPKLSSVDLLSSQMGAGLYWIQADFAGEPLSFALDKFNQALVSEMMLTPGANTDFYG